MMQTADCLMSAPNLIKPGC